MIAVSSRFRLGLVAGLVFLGAATAPVAYAQQTQTEEMDRRARVLATLPADAAKRHFGSARSAYPSEARVIGSYAKGCLAGATAIAADGPTWQVMRPSRNRAWGHPDLIATIERLARRAPGLGWSGLLVGDISQPRGGPMLTGHASHQVGLDADLWLTPMPGRTLSTSERENMSATNVVADSWMDVNPAVWTSGHRNIIRAAAQDPAVVRIFVNPAIKVALCRDPGGDRSWLSKVRPMWSHNYHFHIRMACPAGDTACADQDPPPEGDGCGAELSDWLKRQQKAIFGPKKGGGGKPARPIPLSAMPPACQQIVLTR
jgi:penicillin-insensitive murein endopeptidase